MNKKGKDEGVTRKKVRKTARVARAIVGLSVDDLKNKRKPNVPKAASAASAAAAKEVKDRKKNKGNNAPRASGGSVPKLQVKHK